MAIDAVALPAELTVTLIRSSDDLLRSATLFPGLAHFLAAIPPHSVPCCALVTQADRMLAAICGYRPCMGPFPRRVLRIDLPLSSFEVDGHARMRVLRAVVHGFLRIQGVQQLQIDVAGLRTDIVALREGARERAVEFNVVPGADERLLVLDKFRELCPDFGRQALPTGVYYAPQIPIQAFHHAACDLLEKRPSGFEGPAINRALARISQAQEPILAGIRHSDGRWIGLVGGWFEDHRAVLAFEIHERTEKASKSLQSLVLADLISQGIDEVLFLSDVGFAFPLANVQRTFQVRIRKRRFYSCLRWSHLRAIAAE